MTAFVFDLEIDQGASVDVTVNLVDDNGDALAVANCSAVAVVKTWYTSNTGVEFDVTLVDGEVQLALTSNATSNIASGNYVWDCLFTDELGNTDKIAKGKVVVFPTASLGA